MPGYEEPVPQSSVLKSSDWTDDPLCYQIFHVYRCEATSLHETLPDDQYFRRQADRDQRKDERKWANQGDEIKKCYKWKRSREELRCLPVWPKESGTYQVKSWRTEKVDLDEAEALRRLKAYRTIRDHDILGTVTSPENNGYNFEFMDEDNAVRDVGEPYFYLRDGHIPAESFLKRRHTR